MSVRTQRWSTNGINQFETLDSTQSQREMIDSEGYIYHVGINEERNFLDDGRGAAVVGSGTSVNVVEDAIPFGSSRS